MSAGITFSNVSVPKHTWNSGGAAIRKTPPYPSTPTSRTPTPHLLHPAPALPAPWSALSDAHTLTLSVPSDPPASLQSPEMGLNCHGTWPFSFEKKESCCFAPACNCILSQGGITLCAVCHSTYMNIWDKIWDVFSSWRCNEIMPNTAMH